MSIKCDRRRRIGAAMAKIGRPVEFTTEFKVTAEQLDKLGAYNPALNVDTRLFIDPVLLRSSKYKIINVSAEALFRKYFEDVIKLIRASRKSGDLPWRTAHDKLVIREPRYTSLGFGGSSIHGRAIGPEMAERILHTAAEIVALGIEDPDLFKLLPLLEHNMGPDRISDMTTHAIYPALAKYTEVVAKKLGIKTQEFGEGRKRLQLPVNPLEPELTPVILVPKDILKRLPVASDWSEVANAAAYNQALRSRINAMIGDIWEKEVRANRKKLRKAALAKREAYESLMAVASEGTVQPYSLKTDIAGLVGWRELLTWIAAKYPRCSLPDYSVLLRQFA